MFNTHSLSYVLHFHAEAFLLLLFFRAQSKDKITKQQLNKQMAFEGKEMVDEARETTSATTASATT